MGIRKFTAYETYLIVEAIKSQRNEQMAYIESQDKKGKLPLFTKGYIEKQHNDIIKLIESNERK